MNKILLVQQNWLGDVLFATPAIRAVRRHYPNAHIACLVPPRVKGVLLHNPHVNEVIVCEDRLSFTSPAFWKTVSLLRSRHFDAAIFFHRSKTKVLMAFFAGIHRRWGYAFPGRAVLLNRMVPLPKGKPHKIDYFLNLLRGLGIATGNRFMEFTPAPAAETELENIFGQVGLKEGESYVVVHAGGNWRLKRWPVEYFSQWIYYFLESYGWKVFLCGTAEEEKIAEKIVGHFPEGSVVSLCGKTSLDALALLLKGAKLLLSNDSGPIHLAASQKTPIVGVFGPTSSQETGPVSEAAMRILQKDVGCQIPCYFEACNYRVCMDFLLPREVFQETQFLLESA